MGKNSARQRRQRWIKSMQEEPDPRRLLDLALHNHWYGFKNDAWNTLVRIAKLIQENDENAKNSDDEQEVTEEPKWWETYYKQREKHEEISSCGSYKG